MLITYADSMGRDLKELETALAKYFEGAVKGIHILPFFPFLRGPRLRGH